jgi:hypothetical protein
MPKAAMAPPARMQAAALKVLRATWLLAGAPRAEQSPLEEGLETRAENALPKFLHILTTLFYYLL